MPDRKKIETAADFVHAFAVSRETVERLELYARLLSQWQTAVNLVASASLQHVWGRHFADSVQLIDLAPGAKTWIDLGSGAGFPGLAVAICLPNQQESFVHLVESNSRKCAFLSEVARRTGAPVRIHNGRIADVAVSGAIPAVEVIIARALAPLDRLLELALPFFGAASAGLFLKGREAASEIADASARWTFDVSKHPSLSDPEGAILKMTEPRLKRDGENGKREPVHRA